jgi:hypothetical protein
VPRICQTYGYEQNEWYRLYLYQDEDGGHAQKAIESGQRLISRVEYVHIGPFGDILSTKNLPATMTRQEYSYLLNELLQPLTYWNPAPILRRDEALRIVILKLARNHQQKRIEIDFQLLLRPGLAQGDLDRSVNRPGESRLTRNSAPSSSAARAAADPELNIVHDRPPSPMRDQHLELAAMFWELIDDLEFEHRRRDQTGSSLFLAVSSHVSSDSETWAHRSFHLYDDNRVGAEEWQESFISRSRSRVVNLKRGSHSRIAWIP